MLAVTMVVPIKLYGTNSPLIFASLIRYSLLHFHLSPITYHIWQIIIFTILTITTCIFSYSFSISF